MAQLLERLQGEEKVLAGSAVRMFMAAYNGLISFRVDSVCKALPYDMQSICRIDEKPSPTNLFGDKLQENARMLSEKEQFGNYFKSRDSAPSYKSNNSRLYAPKNNDSSKFSRGGRIQKKSYNSNRFVNK